MNIARTPQAANPKSAQTQLSALGYTPSDAVYFRAISKSKGASARKFEGTLGRNSGQLEKLNSQGYGIYFVVNGQGDTDKAVAHGRALFYEHDNLPKIEQAGLWAVLGLPEPSLQIDTGGKSIHSYWTLETPIAIEDWKTLQADLLNFADADRTISNPSRVMRLAGFTHQGSGGESVVILNSGKRYSFEEMRSAIPVAKPKEEPRAKKQAKTNTQASGKIDKILSDDILPLLAVEQIFNWAGHEFTEDSAGKLKGNCPWHDSQSGTSFWVTRSSDGVTYSGACPSCTGNKKLNAIGYRYALKTGNPQAGQPIGPAFMEILKELASDAGVTLPNYSYEGRSDRYSSSGSNGSSEQPQEALQTLWKCLPVHNYQVGFWNNLEIPASSESEIAQAHDRAKTDVNLKYSGRVSKDKGDFEIFKEFSPRTNFDLKVSKILEDSTGGGLEFEVTWIDRSTVKSRKSLVKTSETLTPKDFVLALTKGLGGHFTSILKPNELAILIQNRKAEYSLKGGVVYRLAERTGQQEDGTWVFEDVQFTSEGIPTNETETRWMFNQSLGELEQVPSPKIVEQNPEALVNLVSAVKGFFHEKNTLLVWFACGYTVATMQRHRVMELERCFPQLNFFGDAGGGKTTAAIVGASLVGMHSTKNVVTKFSESVIYEESKSLGGVMVVLDDPVKPGGKKDSKKAVDDFLWDMFNGSPRRVRGNNQFPQTNFLVTSNVALGEGTTAIESRLLKINFPKRAVNSVGFPALDKAMNQATGALSQLLAIQYDRDVCQGIEARLLEHLTSSHARMAKSIALITYFTQKFCDAAGIVFNAFEYAVKELCPVADSFESNKDSLTDFLEKVSILKSENKLGEWNVSQVTTRDHKSYLAIHMAAVWPVFESNYPSTNYSKQSIEALVLERGGINQSPQKLVASKSAWQDYQRALNNFEMGTGQRGPDDMPIEPAKPKKSKSNRCSLIPTAIVDEAIGGEDATNTNYSSNNSPAWEPTPVKTEEPATTPPQVKAGDYATVKVDRVEAELQAGDEVLILSVAQDPSNGNQWYAIVQSGNEKPSFPVWLCELQLHDPTDL